MTRTKLGDAELFKPEEHDGRFILTSIEQLSVGQIVMRGDYPFQIVRELTHAEAIKMVSGEPGLAVAFFEPFFYEAMTD